MALAQLVSHFHAVAVRQFEIEQDQREVGMLLNHFRRLAGAGGIQDGCIASQFREDTAHRLADECVIVDYQKFHVQAPQSSAILAKTDIASSCGEAVEHRALQDAQAAHMPLVARPKIPRREAPPGRGRYPTYGCRRRRPKLTGARSWPCGRIRPTR